MRNRRQPSGAFFRRLKAYSKQKPVSPVRKFKESEIWQWAGIVEFIAIVAGLAAVLLTVWHIRIDLQDRQTQRITQAWQLVTTPAPGNSGKGPALEYLNSQGVSLTGIDLSAEENQSGVFLSRVNLSGAYLSRADLSGAYLFEADLSGAGLNSADLSEASLIGAHLLGADLTLANLSGADFHSADLLGAILRGADLSGAYLDNTNLSRANLRDADLLGANLRDADLLGANFRDADLLGAVLLLANLSGANLGEARSLSQDQLDSACGDNETQLPEGFSIKACSED